MYNLFSQDIAAISTPYGHGGIAVIRISGDNAIEIASKFVFPKSKKDLNSIESNYAFLADVKEENGEVIDEAIITMYRAPKSFTGENVVEISCHGGILLSKAILERTFECGAIQATAGEFTRRAFSYGKISLSQAEAIIGKIEAKTKSSLKIMQGVSSGKVKNETDEIYDDIANIVASIYANIDFPDEDLAELSYDEILEKTKKVKERLIKLEKSYKTGHAVCEGIETAIVGKPNTGKSTILNLLTEKDSAIVTDVAGTTRDVISESVEVNNILLHLNDTAGIRETSNEIEKIGISKSISVLEKAELIIAVFDSSKELDDEDKEIINLVKEKSGATVLCVLNKSDLGTVIEKEDLGFDNTIIISAKDEKSKELLSNYIEKLFIENEELSNDVILTNERQQLAIKQTLECVISAEEALKNYGDDLSGSELERALSFIGEVDGRKVGEDVVDKIFHNFCVGK